MYILYFHEKITIMKKMASAVLFISLIAPANAFDWLNDIKTSIEYNKSETIAATILTAIAASAYYYEIKYNNFKVLKKAKRFIKNHPKASTGILTANTAAVALITDGILRQEESLFFKFMYYAFINPYSDKIPDKDNKDTELDNSH